MLREESIASSFSDSNSSGSSFRNRSRAARLLSLLCCMASRTLLVVAAGDVEDRDVPSSSPGFSDSRFLPSVVDGGVLCFGVSKNFACFLIFGATRERVDDTED